ncbi:S-layer homology domain-containing protein [Intestinibacillus massiliensis]
MKIFTKRLGAAVIAFALLCGIGTVPAGAEGLQASAEEGVTPPSDGAGQETGTPPADSAGQGTETPPADGAGQVTETPPADSAGQETGTPPADGAGQAGNGIAPEEEGRNAAAPSPANFAGPAADGLPDDGARQVTLDNGTLYANGVPVVIKKDGDGQKAVYDADGAIKLMDAPNLTTVYGGGKNADVDGDTSVTVEDLSLTVYGGGYSDGTHSANVSGDAYITYKTSGQIKISKINGGGCAEGKKANAQANIGGTVHIDAYSANASGGESVNGGGNANAQAFDAEATVGAVDLQFGGRMNNLCGGGSAAANGEHYADASVLGAIQLKVSDGDVRDMYGVGWAKGENGTATAASVDITIQGGEYMSITGGGNALDMGTADVYGNIAIHISGAFNLYGYIVGGGWVWNTGSANVQDVEINLTGCVMPPAIQLGNVVAAAIYAGGKAGAAGSQATAGNTRINLSGGNLTGHVYCGGADGEGTNAHVVSSQVTVEGVQKNTFEIKGQQHELGLYIIADEVADEHAGGTVGTVGIAVSNSAIDKVVGGNVTQDDPEESVEARGCDVSLYWGAGNSPDTQLHFINHLAIEEPYTITSAFIPATGGTAVKAASDAWVDGDVLLTYANEAGDAETLGLVADGGLLTMEPVPQDGTAVQWRYTKPAKEPEPAPDPEPDPEPGTPTPNPPSGGSTSSSSPSTPGKPSESTKVEDKGGATVETVTKTEVSGSTTTVTETQTATDRQTGEVTRTETVSMDDKQSGVSTKVTTQTGADGAVTAEAYTEVNTGTATVKDGVASAVLGGQAAQALIQQAEKAAQALGQADQAKAEVVVQAGLPEGQAASVGTVQVQLPKKAAAALGTQAAADMTVKTPVADVTIPSKALADLAGRTGDTVTVSAARAADDTVRVAVSVGGREAGQVEGGLKAAVPSPSLTAGTVAVVVKADGTEELVPKSVVVGDGMVVPLEGSATIRLVDNSKPFADASQAPWAEPALSFVSARGLFTGVDDTHFDPGGAVSRGMLATVLSRLEDAPQAATAQRFDDVQPGQYYSSAVHWAAENGIVSGDGTGKFAPDRAISREELAVCLYRYSGMLGAPTGTRAALDGFADAHQVSGWAQDAMAYAVGAGLMDGKDGRTLDPQGGTTRAEAAATVMRLVEYLAKA